METVDKKYSVAVFPFLKTSRSSIIGQYVFRSTDDLDKLPSEQGDAVRDIAEMLYLKDDFRIKTASFAIVPFVDLRSRPVELTHLLDLQAFVAYLYSSPHPTIGHLFLSSDHASIAIFSPGVVSKYLLNPDFNVSRITPVDAIKDVGQEEVSGFSGVYNFRHPFWVTKGSRLYGPQPDMILNRSQDLKFDVDRANQGRADYRLLARLLNATQSEWTERVFTAVRWFNSANQSDSDEAISILHLAIAFEAILQLPADVKTDRVTDAISLLLGRIPRLDAWADQFYRARSQVVHEGAVLQTRFVATDNRKNADGQLFNSLLTYGRQIFQGCLGALLVGNDFAQRAGLEEQFVTNKERFQKICAILNILDLAAVERLEKIKPIVNAIETYRFVPESDLKSDEIIGAVRLTARTYLDLAGRQNDFDHLLREPIDLLANRGNPQNRFAELNALRQLNGLFAEPKISMLEGIQVLRDLVGVAWRYLYSEFFEIVGRQREGSEMKAD